MKCSSVTSCSSAAQLPCLSSNQKLIISLVIGALSASAAIFLFVKGYHKQPLLFTASSLCVVSILSFAWAAFRIQAIWKASAENQYIAAGTPKKTTAPDKSSPYTTPKKRMPVTQKRESITRKVERTPAAKNSIEVAKQCLRSNSKTYAVIHLDDKHAVVLYSTSKNQIFEYEINQEIESLDELLNEHCQGYKNCLEILGTGFAFEIDIPLAHGPEYTFISMSVNRRIVEDEFWVIQLLKKSKPPTSPFYFCLVKQNGAVSKFFFNEKATSEFILKTLQVDSNYLTNGFIRWKGQQSELEIPNSPTVAFYNGEDFESVNLTKS